MNILMLGPHRPDFIEFFQSFGDNVRGIEKRINHTSTILNSIDIVVSYGYRHILKNEFLLKFPQRVINLHISYLPWNRGADPNLWSFLDDTPKGVTLHLIDAGIDTGGIILQRQVDDLPDDTLRTSYERLNREIKALFFEAWPVIRTGECSIIQQPSGGSFHYKKDKEAYNHLLTREWDTQVSDIIGKAKKKQGQEI